MGTILSFLSGALNFGTKILDLFGKAGDRANQPEIVANKERQEREKKRSEHETVVANTAKTNNLDELRKKAGS